MLNDAVLIKLSCSDSFLAIKTYDVKHGASNYFYVRKETIVKLIAGEHSACIDNDLESYARIAYYNHSFNCRFAWLKQDCSGNLTGYVQTFAVPMEKVCRALNGELVRHVHHEFSPMPKAKLSFTPESHEAIAELCQFKHKRNAFIKCLRDHFNYGSNETITVYPDSLIGGFYFSSDTSSFNGGIVPYCTQQTGSDRKKHICFSYSIHT